MKMLQFIGWFILAIYFYVGGMSVIDSFHSCSNFNSDMDCSFINTKKQGY